MTQDNANANANANANVDPVSAQGEDSCLSCCYWTSIPGKRAVRTTRTKSMGECRISPPAVLIIDETPVTVFPLTGSETWCGRFDNGEPDEDDEDEELEGKPTYQELTEMLTAALDSTGPALAKLDAIRSVVAERPSKRRDIKAKLVFHKVPEGANLFDELSKMMSEQQGREQAEAEELAEEERHIMNGEEEPGLLDPDDPLDQEALDALRRDIDQMSK